jgi:hypothetical protein
LEEMLRLSLAMPVSLKKREGEGEGWLFPGKERGFTGEVNEAAALLRP